MGKAGLKAAANRLTEAQNYIEMNYSNMLDKDREGKTRVGYKEKMKLSAFHTFEDGVAALQLHDTVLRRACDLFASYRDAKETLVNLPATQAACVVMAFRARNELRLRCVFCW